MTSADSPQALFDQQYPALAHRRSPGRSPTESRSPGWGWTRRGGGLDHGTWSVLKPMFPEADIPVVQ